MLKKDRRSKCHGWMMTKYEAETARAARKELSKAQTCPTDAEDGSTDQVSWLDDEEG